jgi:hypothetical protein
VSTSELACERLLPGDESEYKSKGLGDNV